MVHFTVRGLLTIIVLSFIVVASVPAPMTVSAQAPPEINWAEGPATVDLGDVAKIELGEEKKETSVH